MIGFVINNIKKAEIGRANWKDGKGLVMELVMEGFVMEGFVMEGFVMDQRVCDKIF